MDTLTFREPRIVALALLVIVAGGLSAFFALGRQEDPTITNINAVITTPYPGASPDRVESLVTRPLEEELREIPEISVIESTSATGVSVISLELIETVDPRVIEGIWSEARDKIADAERDFPAGVLTPEFDSDSFGAAAAILALRPSGEAASPTVMARYAEEAAERLRTLAGTKTVKMFGEPEEEVLVRLDADAAAALGLTPDAVSAAITAADAKVQSGRLFGGGSDLLLDVEGDIEATERVARIVVAENGSGTVTRLGDIAEITRGPRAPAEAHALSDGKPAILISLTINDGLRIDQWQGWLEEDLAAIRAELPASLELVQVFDQSGYTADRLAEVAMNMGIGVALVVGVLLVTLGVRAALIVAFVLPIVSLATLATMNFIGLPIHQMSVTGLIVALGLLVDAAIVMTDEIRQRLARGMERLAAVGEAVRRLTVPLLASTVTTALSFVPMILLPGPAGDFVGAIAIAVVLMLVWSFLVAITLTPAIAGWFLPGAGQRSGLAIPALPRGFHGLIAWTLRNPVKSVAFALVLPVMGFMSFPTLTAQFFPGVDRDQFHIEVELRPGTGIDRTLATAREIDAHLAATPGITSVNWVIGKSAPAFYYNIVGNRDRAPDYAHALVTTADPDTTAALLSPLQAELDASWPGARILVRGLVQGPPVDAPLELRVVGPDLTTLRALGEEIRTVLLARPAVTIVRADLEGGAPKLAVDIDEAAARLAGLDLAGVARQLQAGLDGAVGGSLIEAGEELAIRVRYGAGIRADAARIGTLRILPADARAQAVAGVQPGVPLAAIADIRLVPSESAIQRRDGQRVNTVQAFLQPDILPQEALADAREALEASGFALPNGYTLEIGGDSDARSDVVGNLLAPLGLIVTLSIATVVLSFNSFRLSAITFVVAVLSAGLSILALAVFQYPFGITAIIGVIGSIGVSINAAIIILTGLQASPAARAGDTEAMAEVVTGSSRHILSTTLTTAGGFLPLILAGGGFWPPFAMSVAGGVFLSTVVSFFFTPQMFALLRRREAAPAPEVSPIPAPFPRLAAE
ncbi:efflux RND transporter permease subunit [Ovoidimarina sediminis]|uniref:efflux RND transporter permease subunit n=1 Tax=Ovoidimarina sediminis TaxID=3079856 RepID=UPI002907B911|nr:efflux RND transporter permease subunit [Rhodophyticola sp. MJ-SS7]MDU8944990.1 efflux RND transporter permease subunit [Rhodophyticola sp. MJ-SS7]